MAVLQTGYICQVDAILPYPSIIVIPVHAHFPSVENGIRDFAGIQPFKGGDTGAGVTLYELVKVLVKEIPERIGG